MPSHLVPELLLMVSRCALGPLRGKLPGGHSCSFGHLYPKSLVQALVHSYSIHPDDIQGHHRSDFLLVWLTSYLRALHSCHFHFQCVVGHMKAALWNKTAERLASLGSKLTMDIRAQQVLPGLWGR